MDSELPSATIERKSRRGLVVGGLVLMAIGVAIGVAGDRLIGPSKIVVQTVRPQPPTSQGIYSRVGDRIVVPPGSPLRTRLVLDQPSIKEVSHSLVLPALVEADPARTVKVMPPVAGRVIDLKVQLGVRVVQGQELAMIDSGDLAQAYSDIEKARSTVDPHQEDARSADGPEKAGGAAVKDREQAQSDHAQARPNSNAPKPDCARWGFRPTEGTRPAALPESAGRRQRHRPAGRAGRISQ